jgi:gliding motility-associated-like protein
MQYSLNGGTFQSSPVFSGVSNGTYIISVRNAAGCISSGLEFLISCGCVNPPILQLNGSSNKTCGTSPLTINGNTFGGSATGVSLTTNGSGSLSSTNNNTSPFSFTYTPSASDIGKTVLISVTTNNPLGAPCVSSSATFTLTVNAIPSAPGTGTITHPSCASPLGSLVINGLPSSGVWTLTGIPGNISREGTGISTTVSGLEPGSYTFTVASAEGCVSASSQSISINSQPQTPSAPEIIGITHPTCNISTGSVQLGGLPGTGSWTIVRNPGGIISTGSGTSTSISGILPGTYTFTVTNSAGCNSFASMSADINPQPLAPNAPLVGSITAPSCELATGSVVLENLPSEGDWTITRYPGTVVTSGNGESRIITELSPGIYNFTVSNASGCISQLSSNVIIPVQPATPAAPIIGSVAQPSFAVPSGSVELKGLPASGTWTIIINPGGASSSGTGSSAIIAGLEGGVYSFRVRNSNGCISTPSEEVTISTPGMPELLITNPSPVCAPGTIDLTRAEITEGSTAGLIFTYWRDAGVEVPLETPENAASGTYYIMGTTVTGFFSIQPVIVTVLEAPVANAGSDLDLNFSTETSLNALPPSNGTGLWSVVSGSGIFTDANNPQTTVRNLSLGENILEWTVSNEVCPPSSDQILITISGMTIPTLLTPNMDGKNDFLIVGDLEKLGRTELIVFDRRGALLFNNKNYKNDWDGVDNNGRALPDDTYFLTIIPENGKSISSFIVIRR